MQKKLQVVDFCKVDPLFYEGRFSVIQHKLFPHMEITPWQKLNNLLHKPRQAFVQQNPRHFRHRVVDVRYSQYFHSQFFHSLLESQVPNSRPGEREHADGVMGGEIMVFYGGLEVLDVCEFLQACHGASPGNGYVAAAEALKEHVGLNLDSVAESGRWVFLVGVIARLSHVSIADQLGS
nr:hypothetical protein Iba_chr13bCG1910 [Ipomoea batatas]